MGPPITHCIYERACKKEIKRGHARGRREKEKSSNTGQTSRKTNTDKMTDRVKAMDKNMT